MTVAGGEPGAASDPARAVRFLAVKAAVFILVPLLISFIAVYFKLR